LHKIAELLPNYAFFIAHLPAPVTVGRGFCIVIPAFFSTKAAGAASMPETDPAAIRPLDKPPGKYFDLCLSRIIARAKPTATPIRGKGFTSNIKYIL